MALFALVNPFYGIPVFLGMTEGYAPAKRRRTALVVAITVFLSACISALIGEEILTFFGVHIAAFQIAGGLIVLGAGFAMIRGDEKETSANADFEAEEAGSRQISVVPLSIPLTIGPGTFAMLILFSHQHDLQSELFTMVPVIFAASLVLWLGLMFAVPISDRMGNTAMNVIVRMMAIILVAVAIEMVVTGAFHAFQIHYPLLDLKS